MAKPLYLILLTYNGGNDLPLFLSSLKETVGASEIVLIAIDNNSSDNSAEYVRTHYPEAHLIQNKENLGFAGGCNVGFRYALGQGAEHIMLVNQDLVFEKGWLPPLRQMLADNPKIGALQSRIMLYDDKTKINSYGNALHYLGYGYTRGYRMSLPEWQAFDQTHALPLFNCSGAAVVYTAQALTQVGYFGEEYFMYHEDTDLSWRLRLAGYELGVCEDSVVYHRYEFSRSIAKFYYIERNRLITIFKNYHWATLILIAPMLVIMELGMVGYSTIGYLQKSRTIGLKEKLASYAYFFNQKNLKLLFQERKKSQALRRVPDTKIIEQIASEVLFQDINNPLITKIANPLMSFYWRLVTSLIFW